MEKKRIVIFDSNSIIHRAFHALPPLSTQKGELINAVYGFLLVAFKAIREFQPDYLAAAFDLPLPTFRHEKFKGYKAKRPPAPEGLCQQIPMVKEVLDALHIPVFQKEGFEADDIIGTITTSVSEKKDPAEIEIIIMSGDLDSLQLVGPTVKVCALRKGVKDTVFYDERFVGEKYQGLRPEQMVDFKALRGDPSDNIPGVKGVGEKTAIELLLKFGSLENLYKQIEGDRERTGGTGTRLREILIKNKDIAFLSKDLAQLEKNVPIDFSLEKCRWGEYDKNKIVKLFKKLEFHSLIGRLPEAKKEERKTN